MAVEMGRDYDGEKKLRILQVRGKVPVSKEVRFVRDDKVNIANKKARGYHFPTKEELAGMEVAGETSNDGVCHVADTVLMLIDKDKAESNRRAHQELVRHRRQAVKSDSEFEQTARRSGVRTFVDPGRDPDDES